jgi:hypothetical protein
LHPRITVSAISTRSLPRFASADYRLGNFDAITAGLKYGWRTRNGNEMSIRAEVYQQSGAIPGDLLIGNQVGTETYPDLDAIGNLPGPRCDHRAIQLPLFEVAVERPGFGAGDLGRGGAGLPGGALRRDGEPL